MKGLAMAVIFWVGIVPSVAGSFLILAFLAALLSPLYFALAWFAFSVTTFAALFGPFCLMPMAHSERQSNRSPYRNPTSPEEMEHEHSFAGKIRS